MPLNSLLLTSSTMTIIVGQPQQPYNWSPCFHLCCPTISSTHHSQGRGSFWNENRAMSLPCSLGSNHFPAAFIKPGSIPCPTRWHPWGTYLIVRRHGKFEDGPLLQISLLQLHEFVRYSLNMPSNFLPHSLRTYPSLWWYQFSPKFQHGSVFLHSDVYPSGTSSVTAFLIVLFKVTQTHLGTTQRHTTSHITWTFCPSLLLFLIEVIIT